MPSFLPRTPSFSDQFNEKREQHPTKIEDNGYVERGFLLLMVKKADPVLSRNLFQASPKRKRSNTPPTANNRNSVELMSTLSITEAVSEGLNACSTIYNFYTVNQEGKYEPRGKFNLERSSNTVLSGMILAPQRKIDCVG